MRNPSVALGIRIMCGCYLIYLAVKLFMGVASGEATGTNAIVSIVAGVVFIVLSLYFMYLGYKSFKNAEAEAENEEDEYTFDDEEEIPPAAAPRSISFSAGYVNPVSEDDEDEE